ncbi:hypothetical protein [Maricaulis sp.]|jgi:hypothetical protein|uniref:hypothetical protein n=1 Tax=Maricaulis sp. TaxID=1486257 RepID=UPI0026178B7E|nr:hypothetical protein [Maricaulis sp.]
MSGSDRNSLRRIVRGGATPRILDLWSINRRFGETLEMAAKPFFRNPRLNAGFFLKHTVRPHDRPYLLTDSAVATKIIVPVSIDDLGMGGHSFFVEEKGFESRLKAFLGMGVLNKHYETDLARVKELATVPSFDPFLLADRYSGGERPVARFYFNISADEQEAMLANVTRQIFGIVSLAFGDQEIRPDDERTQKFARQLLDAEESAKLSGLRETLGMSEEQYREGIFGWRGILYYRWRIRETKDDLRRFVMELNDVIVRGATAEENKEVNEIRKAILSMAKERWRALTNVMDEYDSEYRRFCDGADPSALRTFLLKAPGHFGQLGADLSAVSHVTSFWSYWWKDRERGSLSAKDALDIFPGFLRSLTSQSTERPYGEGIAASG